MVKSEDGNLTNGEKNFIESKDTLHYNFTTNCLLHGTLIIFCVAEILLYLFKYAQKSLRSSLFGFVFVIVIATFDIINVLFRLCLRKKYQHIYYGVSTVLISLYLHYFAIKVALYPFGQLFSFMAVGIWVIFSVSLIYAIVDNIKNDRYNDDSEDIYFFKDQTVKDGRYFFQTKIDVSEVDGKKFGIVVTWHTKISGLAYIILAIVLITVYITSKALFDESGKLLVDFAHGGLIVALLLLSFITNFGWKLIIKQIYVNKA